MLSDTSIPLTVAGVDGCRGGWVVVRALLESGSAAGADRAAGAAGRRFTAEHVEDLRAVVDQVRAGELAAMAVDMPIGLFEDRPRPCDIAARVVLGSRRSTVFPAPVRATLGAGDYVEACRLSRAASGKALSKQAYNLLNAIRHLDELLVPADAERIVEAHPECAFARLGDGPLTSKHKPEGRARRLELLDQALGPEFVSLRTSSSLPMTDLLDAAALTVTARHVVEGSDIRLGGESDPTGKPAQVVY